MVSLNQRMVLSLHTCHRSRLIIRSRGAASIVISIVSDSPSTVTITVCISSVVPASQEGLTKIGCTIRSGPSISAGSGNTALAGLYTGLLVKRAKLASSPAIVIRAGNMIHRDLRRFSGVISRAGIVVVVVILEHSRIKEFSQTSFLKFLKHCFHFNHLFCKSF